MRASKTLARFIFLCSTIAVCHPDSRAQSPYLYSIIKSGGNGFQSAVAVGTAIDQFTNAYVLGRFDTFVTVGTSTRTNTSPFTNFFIAKFRTGGSPIPAPTPVWVVAPTIDSPLQNLRFRVHLSYGSFVAGGFAGTNIAFGNRQITNSVPGITSDVFLGRYDQTGAAQWLVNFGGTGVDNCGDLGTDLDGNTFVTGSFESGSFAAGTFNLTRQSTNGSDCFLIKCDPNGVVLWARQGSYAAGNKVALDNSGNCFVAGATLGTSVFDALSPTNPTTGQFLIKYDGNGSAVWCRGDLKIGNQMIVDNEQNIITAGTFSGTAQFGTTTLSNNAPATIFIAKYDNAGTVLWAKQLPGSGRDEVTGMFVDSQSKYWLTGSFASFDASEIRLNPKMFLVTVDSGGTLIGVGQDTGSGTSSGNGFSVFQNFLCGTFSTNVSFSGISLTNNGDSDIFLARLSPFPPAISAKYNGTNLVQSWPDPRSLGFQASETFSLETSASLGGGWASSTNIPALVGGQYVVTNKATGAAQFYRLRK